MKKRRALKLLAKKKGIHPRELLALSRSNDPFYIGSGGQYRNAKWAVKLYSLLNPGGAVHLRRLHYFALTQPEHLKPDGRMYLNTSANWKFLRDAFKFARYLKLLPHDAFVDRRNILAFTGGDYYPRISQESDVRSFIKEGIESLFRMQVNIMMRSLFPVHIEIWSEKSSATDLIYTVGQKYNINLITSMGEISLTAVWQFIKRVRSCKKPIRIFYLSDFDPAGVNMPVSVSRKIEFLMRQYGLSRKLDVKLKPLMLTRDQCDRFNLPGQPSQETKGRGQVSVLNKRYCASELHALEVAMPGYICRTVNKQLKRYLDLSKISRAKKMAEQVRGRLLGEIYTLVDSNEDLNAVSRLMERSICQNAGVGDFERDEMWLFNSRRGYIKQLMAYRVQRLSRFRHV